MIVFIKLHIFPLNNFSSGKSQIDTLGNMSKQIDWNWIGWKGAEQIHHVHVLHNIVDLVAIVWYVIQSISAQ